MKQQELKTVLIIQARMGSTRLPGKVLMSVLNEPLLARMLRRVKGCLRVDEIWVATTKSPLDDPIEFLGLRAGVHVYRGSEENVLQRYFETARESNADVIIRCTGDCPLMDPAVIDQAVQMFLDGTYDYVSNTRKRTFPRGMDVEVFSREMLEQAMKNASLPSEHEHVTPYIFKHARRMGDFFANNDYSNIRITVDTQEDFALIQRIIEELEPKNPDFNLRQIIEVLLRNPDWLRLNAHVIQKGEGS